MLLNGIQHVATLTNDTARLLAFYAEVFDATEATVLEDQPGLRMTNLELGGGAGLNIFQIDGNTEADRQVPMFGRGRIDHLGLSAPSLEAFDELRSRLMARGAADDFVTDFGPVLSVFFTDPDGLEGEVCVVNPDAVPDQSNPPGTRSARYPAP